MRRHPDPPGLPVGRWLLLAAVLACAGLAAYLPVLHAGFVWDDDTFLTANPLIRATDGLRRFWCTTQASDYWPVTSTTLWLEWRLWGLHAIGYHCTNLALHLGNGLLLWSVLRRLRVPGAYLAALLFVVHPVNVESVAWIAQRKNLLAMLFYLASIRWYFGVERVVPNALGDAANRTSALGTTRSTYWLSLLAFILAMLSKGSVAPLPVVLALILWWQGRLCRREWLRLVPFFLVAAILVAVDVWFQHHGASAPLRSAGFVPRLLGAGAVVWFYLLKAVWPAPLIFFYPAWHIDPENWRWWLPLAAALGLSAALWRKRQSPRARPVFFAWAYVVVMLVPVMGFTDVYFMKYSLVADHYQHLALIGVVGLVAAVWERSASGPPSPAGRGLRRLSAQIIAGAAICALSLLTFRQCRSYRDLETLYRDTLEKNPASWLAQNNLGVQLLDQGQTEAAMARFREALRLNPGYAEAHIDLGHAYLRLQRPAEAAPEFAAALAERSDFDREAHLDLGHAWFQLGKAAEAAAEYRAALLIDPAYSEAHYSLGNVLFAQGRFAAAVGEYRAALRFSADDADTLNNLGSALVRAGRPAEALAEYQRALRLRPGDPAILANLGRAQAAASSTQQ